MKEEKKTTQEIYNRIKEIQEKGNWIESPYRQVLWIPFTAIKKAKEKERERIIEIINSTFGMEKPIQFILQELKTQK